ncbi:MAG: hypothetical protein H0U76_23320 [Ktedonobacteraceae bacterium]|nr:hypothetical protein [Ktedonobacteraceae bacterium]
MTFVQALPLIRRAGCCAYLLLQGAHLLYTPVKGDALLLIHHELTGVVQCIPYRDLACMTKDGVEEHLQQFTPLLVDAPEAPEGASKPVATKRPAKRAQKSNAVA